MSNFLEDFRSAMRAAGLDYGGEINPDGKLHRFNCTGEKESASWYVVHQTDGFLAAAYGCWRRQINATWNSSQLNGNQLSKEEWRELRQKVAQSEALRKTTAETILSEAKLKAGQILSAAKPVDSHLYLLRKSVGVHGEMRLTKDGVLALPLRDENGILFSMQFIAPDKRFNGERDKDFIFGGRASGSFYTVSDNKDGPLVICEGYATGASIYEATGYATVCAMFCGNILPVATALRKKYPERVFILAADNDRFTKKPNGEPTNPGVEAVNKAAAAVKAAIAIPEFSDEDTDSTDFNDLAEMSGVKEVKRTVESAYKEFLIPKFAVLPPVDNATEMVSKNLKLPDLLIEGLLHQGLKGVLGSNSKARKSWILLDAALSVCSGFNFWRWPTKKGKVLYINFEIPRAFFSSRIRKVAEAKGITDYSNLDVWTLRGYGVALFRLLPDLIRQIQFGGYSLVILDPIYKVLGGRDENDAGDIAELCNELEKIAVETEAAVLYGAHFSKGNQAGKEAIDRIGGSGVTTRDADSIITLTKHQEEDCFTVNLILRNLPETKPFVMRWQFPLMIQDETQNPESLSNPTGNGRPTEYNPEEIAMLLEPGSMENKDWMRKASDDYGCSKSQFFRIRRQLIKSGRVMQSQANFGRWMLVRSKPETPSENEQNLRAIVDPKVDPQNPPFLPPQ